MAISPPSDLVLDVVRAADPGELVAAREKMRATSAANEASVLTASNAGFASMLGTAQSAAAKAGLGNVPTAQIDGKVPETYRKFEASILSTFIQEMMPKESEEVYGKGSAGEFWKSMMAEQIANEVSKTGGIGIAEQVYSQSLQRQRAEAPNNTTDESDRGMALSMITDFQRKTLLSPESDTSTATDNKTS
ncbi:MAG: rod-binding protein [Shinella sp.]|nr:MAG: rod-binding protein [Shinella sp.]